VTQLVTADDLCRGAATALTDTLPGLIAAFGLDTPDAPAKPFVAPTSWDQVPTLEALNRAAFPAGAIISPGITGRPVKSSLGTDAVWRIVAGIYDRGTDYNETAGRCRTWAALIRAALLRNPTLGGVASSVTWVGEAYRQIPQKSAARTLAGCSVEFDVAARNVVDVDAIDLPIVLSTYSTVSPL
jgi:hypothetical protein